MTRILLADQADHGLDLGSGTTLPTARPGGAALVRGDTYFHTPTGALWAYNGTAWRPLADQGNHGLNLGSGTTLPTTRPGDAALVRGDTYFHTPTNALWAYNGTAWRPAGTLTVADAAARNALTGMFTGMRVEELDSTRVVRWDGAKWVKVGGPPELLATIYNAGASGAVSTASAWHSLRSIAVPAHTPGQLRLMYDGQWTAGGGQAVHGRLLYPTSPAVEVPASKQRAHNNSVTNTPLGVHCEGYVASDGTAQTLTMQLYLEAAVSTQIYEGSFHVWLV